MDKDIWQIVAFLIVFLYGTIIGNRIFRKDENAGKENALAWSLGLNVLLLGTISMCLSLIGFYSAVMTFLLHTVIVTIAATIKKVWTKANISQLNVENDTKQNDTKQKDTEGMMRYLPTAVIGIILIAATVLYFVFPTYYMWSGRDYGLYIVNAVHTAETGSSLYDRDEFIEENYEELSDIVSLGYPALFSSYEDGVSEHPGDINAQFLPMYWCLLAIGYSLAGMTGLFHTTAIITLVALFVYYAFVKWMSNWKVASAATLLLAICPAQLWGARITQSEQLAQLVFLLMAAFFAYGWREQKNNYIYLATAVLGIGCFCRLDNYILGLGLICMAIYTVLWNRKYCKVMRNAVIQYVIWAAVSLFYGFAVHYHYYAEHWDKAVLKQLVLGNIALILIYAVLLLIKRKESQNLVENICGNKIADKVVLILLAAFFAVLFVTPYLKGEEYQPGALEQYGWYICPVTFVFFVYGLWRYITGDREKYEKQVEPQLLFIGIGLISTMLYSVRPSITMDHYWMSRRFLPVNFPFLILFGMYGIWMLWENRSRFAIAFKAAAVVCVAVIFAYVGKHDKILMQGSSYAGILECYDDVAATLPDDTLILTDNEGSASILRYIYHKNIYLINSGCGAEALQQYLEKNDKLCYVGDIAGLGPQWGLTVTKTAEGSIHALAPESCYNYYPVSWQEYSRKMNVYEVTASGDEHSPVNIIDSLNLCDNSVRDGETIVMNGTGNSFFGPYYELAPGAYELQLKITSAAVNAGEELGTLELVVNEEVVDTYPVYNSDEVQQMEFEIANDAKEEHIVQFRFVKSVEEEAVCESVMLVRK